jgi:hypothetical protein
MGSGQDILCIFRGLRFAIRPDLEVFTPEALIIDPAIPKPLMIL